MTGTRNHFGPPISTGFPSTGSKRFDLTQHPAGACDCQYGRGVSRRRRGRGDLRPLLAASPTRRVSRQAAWMLRWRQNPSTRLPTRRSGRRGLRGRDPLALAAPAPIRMHLKLRQAPAAQMRRWEPCKATLSSVPCPAWD
jgi:hypothetical protein